MSSSSTSTSPIEQQLADVNGQTQKVESKIEKYEAKIDLLELKESLTEREEANLSAWRKEKEDLRKEKQDLREEKSILLKQQLADTDRKTVSSHGLPTLERGGVGAGSASSASENKKHANAKLEVLEFKPLAELTLQKDYGSIWATKDSNQLLWHSESDIQGFVKQVLGDVIAASGLSKEIQLANELSVVDLRPDIWLVLQNGVPVGVVEVKKPSERIMKKPSVFGQIYDYLLQLQSFHGLVTPFGIVSTYTEWRICWLANDASDRLASCDSLSDHATTEENVPDVVENLNDDEEVGNVDLGEPKVMPQECRLVHGTGVIPFHNENLVVILASLLHKMTHVQLSPVQMLDESRPYIVVNEDSWYWANISLPSGDVRLSSRSMPNANTQQFWLLKDFRGGVDGRVWLACSRSALACVIKFGIGEGKDEDKKAMLEEEMKRWKVINNEDRVRVQRIAGSWALVMPYLRRATAADLENEESCQAIKNEVQRWAANGYKQQDAALRHVGWMSPVGKHAKASAVFFDLAHVETGVDQEDAATYMFNKLKLGFSI